MFNLLKKKNTIDKDSKIIDIVDGKIPYNEIKNEDKITFIIITQDEDILKNEYKLKVVSDDPTDIEEIK